MPVKVIFIGEMHSTTIGVKLTHKLVQYISQKYPALPMYIFCEQMENSLIGKPECIKALKKGLSKEDSPKEQNTLALIELFHYLLQQKIPFLGNEMDYRTLAIEHGININDKRSFMKFIISEPIFEQRCRVQWENIKKKVTSLEENGLIIILGGNDHITSIQKYAKEEDFPEESIHAFLCTDSSAMGGGIFFEFVSDKKNQKKSRILIESNEEAEFVGDLHQGAFLFSNKTNRSMAYPYPTEAIMMPVWELKNLNNFTLINEITEEMILPWVETKNFSLADTIESQQLILQSFFNSAHRDLQNIASKETEAKIIKEGLEILKDLPPFILKPIA